MSRQTTERLIPAGPVSAVVLVDGTEASPAEFRAMVALGLPEDRWLRAVYTDDGVAWVTDEFVVFRDGRSETWDCEWIQPWDDSLGQAEGPGYWELSGPAAAGPVESRWDLYLDEVLDGWDSGEPEPARSATGAQP